MVHVSIFDPLLNIGITFAIFRRSGYTPVAKDIFAILAKKLESVFVEITHPQATNTIIGSIYRHPSLDADDFNEFELRQFIQTLSKHSSK